MKKKAYALAIACLLMGAIGIVGGTVYKNIKDNPQKTEEAKATEEPAKMASTSEQVQKPAKTQMQPELEDFQKVEEEDLAQNATESEAATETVEVVAEVEPARHFNEKEGLLRPVEGDVLLDYSMDTTIFFPTLEQYRYHPAIVLKANVNDEVVAGAAGVITKIEETAETGLTVTIDFGDGYQGVYGQLKDLNFEKGEEIEAGQVLGYVKETTKYYAVEGDNVYFALTKDEKPENPMDYFEE